MLVMILMTAMSLGGDRPVLFEREVRLAARYRGCSPGVVEAHSAGHWQWEYRVQCVFPELSFWMRCDHMTTYGRCGYFYEVPVRFDGPHDEGSLPDPNLPYMPNEAIERERWASSLRWLGVKDEQLHMEQR